MNNSRECLTVCRLLCRDDKGKHVLRRDRRDMKGSFHQNINIDLRRRGDHASPLIRSVQATSYALHIDRFTLTLTQLSTLYHIVYFNSTVRTTEFNWPILRSQVV